MEIMMDTNEQVAPTARLNFGQRVADPAPVENTQTEAVQAEEAQQEAMTAEAEAQPEATVEVEAEAQTETSDADPVDAPEAPVADESDAVEVDETTVENLPTEELPEPAAQQVEQVVEQDTSVVAAETVGEVSGEPIDEAEAVNETMDELRVDPPAEPVEADEPNAAAMGEALAEQEAAEEAPAPSTGSGKSVEELTAEREKLDAEIKAKQDAEKASVIAQIKTVVETYSIPVEELVEALGGLKSKRKGVKAKPKYKDPATGVIWSGRGKEPAWIKGKDRDQFLI